MDVLISQRPARAEQLPYRWWRSEDRYHAPRTSSSGSVELLDSKEVCGFLLNAGPATSHSADRPPRAEVFIRERSVNRHANPRGVGVAAAEATIFVTRITIRSADLQVSDPISGSVRMRTKPQKKALAVNEGLKEDG